MWFYLVNPTNYAVFSRHLSLRAIKLAQKRLTKLGIESKILLPVI
jgi:hypothetical protein